MSRTILFKYTHMFVITFLILSITCKSTKTDFAVNQKSGSICVVLAHPDDESIISGTLAMLTEKGLNITVVYVTSGDDGPDMTGRGLYGDALGIARENEATQAIKAIGISNSPVFLRFPDSHVPEHTKAIKDTLLNIINEVKPQMIITFGPDGITDDQDHIMTGCAADFVFDKADSTRLLLHMAITETSPFYAYGMTVPEDSIDIEVNVSKYAKQRIKVVEAHDTQFNGRVQFMYKILVRTMPVEKYIIAGNRNANDLLAAYFNVK